HARRHIVQLLGAGRGDDDARADVHAVSAQARVGLQLERHPGTQHGSPRISRPKATLSATLSHGNRLASWNTMAFTPRTSTSPLVSVSSPARMRSGVVFPHPLGPTTHTNS